jgi:hypothetical protein
MLTRQGTQTVGCLDCCYREPAYNQLWLWQLTNQSISLDSPLYGSVVNSFMSDAWVQTHEYYKGMLTPFVMTLWCGASQGPKNSDCLIAVYIVVWHSERSKNSDCHVLQSERIQQLWLPRCSPSYAPRFLYVDNRRAKCYDQPVC